MVLGCCRCCRCCCCCWSRASTNVSYSISTWGAIHKRRNCCSQKRGRHNKKRRGREAARICLERHVKHRRWQRQKDGDKQADRRTDIQTCRAYGQDLERQADNMQTDYTYHTDGHTGHIENDTTGKQASLAVLCAFSLRFAITRYQVWLMMLCFVDTTFEKMQSCSLLILVRFSGLLHTPSSSSSSSFTYYTCSFPGQT